ncbi:hypothetical protein L21SP5_00221 [Salinivirga cyanobacteriivorans]|uniref:Uncharacterized protein n=1 Tax=Salinivirga cyanobacteriivorans TaxID=1307839 RepID=A0A0S2HV37_9BACT|nr:hypothetical protein [Salinivirga cyanobacteriivorans]ALO13901.1 hypothetical protein L21SP5_00221 [Salinivirga cyanobacteriivorans]
MIIIISIIFLLKNQKQSKERDNCFVCFYTDKNIEKDKRNCYVLIKEKRHDSLFLLKISNHFVYEGKFSIKADTLKYYFGEVIGSKRDVGEEWISSSQFFDKQKMIITRKYDTVISSIQMKNCVSIESNPLIGFKQQSQKIDICLDNSILIKSRHYENNRIVTSKGLDSLIFTKHLNKKVLKKIIRTDKTIYNKIKVLQ